MNGYGAAGSYRATEVMGSRPEQLVVLLYAELIASLRRAGAAMDKRDYEAKAEQLSRASSIILELMGSLNAEAGGELSSRLFALYRFFLEEIEKAGRNMDRPLLEKIVGMVSTLHKAWDEAVKSNLTETAAAGQGGGRNPDARAQTTPAE